ncbi:MAG: hypothetical protein ABII09_05110 [Planctomycetota bacterium]
MPDKKSHDEGAKIFLGVLSLLGGVICILVPASTLQDRSLFSFVLMGIPLVILGSTYIWEAIEGLRAKKRESKETKDTKGQ